MEDDEIEKIVLFYKNGTFKATYDLVKDAIYEFKYIIDGTYVNDPEADSYKWNDYAGSENSVLVV